MTTVGPIGDSPVEPGSATDGPSEGLTPAAPADGPNPPRARRVRALLLPALVLLGLSLVLALAPVAHLAARRLPLPPNDPTLIVAGATRSDTTAMRNLPVGLPAGVTITSTQDVYPYAVAALGALGAQSLMAVLSSPDNLALYDGRPAAADLLYPYHYPALEPILDAAPPADLRRGATPLAAALIMLAEQPGLDSPAVSKAAPTAFGVLDRMRSAGGCDGQLDLLLLLAADDFTTTGILADEQRRTVSACSIEPTPDWIVGQAQMRNLELMFTPRGPTFTDDKTRKGRAAAIITFQALTVRFPRDTAAVTGLGDAYLRAGLRLLYSQPFTARQDLRLDVAQYNRAAELGADLGRARALVGLGESPRAVRIAAPFVASSPRPGGALEVLLAADEGAHDFAAAETTGQRLAQAGPAAYPTATAFYPALRDSDDLGSVAERRGRCPRAPRP
jgi:cellulose synthase operon protein C